MISVLIPIYNFNVTKLVTEIHSQLSLLNIDFEIICIDDTSTIVFAENDAVQHLKNVIYIKLEKNIGRSKIRNLLASKAKYNWLLFLDVDVFPKEQIFIENYIKYINLNVEKVFIGGLVYENKKPAKEKLLRWVYGKKREEVALSERRKQPYKYFFGGNFLIEKAVFNSIKFNEFINQYGYEDVLFSANLKQHSINVFQIENPVIHLGIETTENYLINIKHSIKNLHNLQEKELLKDIKILKVYSIIKKIKATFIFGKFYLIFKKQLEYLLKSNHPKLFVLDFYKLSYLCYLKNINLD